VAYFGRLPWISLIANPLVVPVQPAVMALAGGAALLGSVWTPLGVPLAWLAWLPTTFTIRVVHALAGLSATSAGLAYPGPLAGAAYVAVLAFLGLRPRKWVEAIRRVAWPRPPATMSMVVSSGGGAGLELRRRAGGWSPCAPWCGGGERSW
jgi:hypothetical protein